MRILGIEFGSWSLKAVEMESRFRKIEILDFHEVRLPLLILDPIETYKKAVAELLAKLPSYPEKIVTSLPAAQTALRFLQIPITQRKKVEQMYRFELEDNLPMKLEDSIVEHHIFKLRDSSLVFAAIAPKKHISTQLEWFKNVGVDPDWLTFEGMGLANLYLSSRNSETATSNDPTLVLDMGHQKTTLAIINQERIEFFRSISWGGASINQSIAINLGIPLEEAEAKKMSALKIGDAGLSGEAQELRDSCSQALTPFLADLNHSLVAYRNLYKQTIQSVEITGGTSKIAGLDAFLTKSLGVPCKTFNPFSSLDVKEDLKRGSDQYRFTESWGRAMVFARKSALLFNFRKQDMGKQTSLNEVSAILKNPNVLKLAKYAAVLAFILFVHVNTASYFAEVETEAASEEVKKVFQDTFKTVPKNLRTTLTENKAELEKFIKQKNSDLEQKMKMVSKTRQPMLGLIRSVSDSFASNVKVDVNKLEVSDRSFIIEGVLYEGDINSVTDKLKRISSFSDVELTKQDQRFSYRGKVNGR